MDKPGLPGVVIGILLVGLPLAFVGGAATAATGCSGHEQFKDPLVLGGGVAAVIGWFVARRMYLGTVKEALLAGGKGTLFLAAVGASTVGVAMAAFCTGPGEASVGLGAVLWIFYALSAVLSLTDDLLRS